jgi:hypothetical protein
MEKWGRNGKERFLRAKDNSKIADFRESSEVLAVGLVENSAILGKLA